jgi:hypothetical protein
MSGSTNSMPGGRLPGHAGATDADRGIERAVEVALASFPGAAPRSTYRAAFVESVRSPR